MIDKDREQAREKQRKRLQTLVVFVSLFVALVGLLYIVSIPLGFVPPNRRLGMTEATLFGSILAFALVLLLAVGAGLERLSISAKGLQVQLRQVQDEVKTLRFLISYFVSEKELEYLKGLTDGHYRFDFTGQDGQWYKQFFVNDLRRLRSLGIIRMRSGKTIGGLPNSGDLAEHCSITDRGQEYLKLRREVDADTD